ncbi:hypothetical protein ABZO31_04975 [Streptomyces sp. HUAS MG47]|uniref:hypothetical protein n=1 Tax=Streptomyces solicamelliae TaxID=3231716 RepID=UPI003877BAA8
MSATGELVLASRWDAVFDVGHWIVAGLRIAFGSLPEWAKLAFAAAVFLTLLGGWAHSRRRRRQVLAASGSDEARVR